MTMSWGSANKHAYPYGTSKLSLTFAELENRQPSDAGVQLSDIWAPELHDVDGNWYIYFAADSPPIGNASHRMYVLKGPPSSVDPMLSTSTFTYVGPVKNLPGWQWAIDGTIFKIDNQWYVVYSGWPTANDTQTQQLFIAKMIDPVTADPSTAVSGPYMISEATNNWEIFQNYHINEGPAWLELGSDFKGIIFSAGASWTSDYQLGILKYLGGDPLDSHSWNKFPQPLLTNNPNGQGPFAPGHCS